MVLSSTGVLHCGSHAGMFDYSRVELSYWKIPAATTSLKRGRRSQMKSAKTLRNSSFLIGRCARFEQWWPEKDHLDCDLFWKLGRCPKNRDPRLSFPCKALLFLTSRKPVFFWGGAVQKKNFTIIAVYIHLSVSVSLSLSLCLSLSPSVSCRYRQNNST